MKKILTSFLSMVIFASMLLVPVSSAIAGGGGICENGNESDGYHILCQGNTITHTPSGLLLRVEKVTPESITLSVFPTTPKLFRLQPGQSKTLTVETTGEVVKITYLQYMNSKIGLFIETLTKPILTIVPYMSSTKFVGGGEQTVATYLLSTNEESGWLCLEVIGLTFAAPNVSLTEPKLFVQENYLVNVGEGKTILADGSVAIVLSKPVCIFKNEPAIISVKTTGLIIDPNIPATLVPGINYYGYTDENENYFSINKIITSSVVTYN